MIMCRNLKKRKDTDTIIRRILKMGERYDVEVGEGKEELGSSGCTMSNCI